jgi:hypothetical protein
MSQNSDQQGSRPPTRLEGGRRGLHDSFGAFIGLSKKSLERTTWTLPWRSPVALILTVNRPKTIGYTLFAMSRIRKTRVWLPLWWPEGVAPGVFGCPLAKTQAIITPSTDFGRRHNELTRGLVAAIRVES